MNSQFKPLKAILIPLFLLPLALVAQKVNYNSEVAKTYTQADQTFCKQFGDDFVHTFNYVVDNTKNLKDYSEIKLKAVEGDKDYHGKAGIKFTPYVYKEPIHLNDLITKSGSVMSAELKAFLNLVNSSIEKSTSYDNFSDLLVKLSKSIEFGKLTPGDKKIASGVVVCTDYTGQTIQALIDKLNGKLGKSGEPVAANFSPGGPSDLVADEEASPYAFWARLVKCAIGTAGGAAGGALAGAAAGSVLPGVGTTAGAIVGGVAGAATGAAASCF